MATFRESHSTDIDSIDAAIAAVRHFSRPHWLDLVRRDQCDRWRSGQGVWAETYFESLPELRAVSEDALVLICGEVHLRREIGDAPALAEYERRFPELADEISVQFDLDCVLADGSSLSPQRHDRIEPWNFELPGFEIVNELGRGGSGVVYLARQLSIDRSVAIKVSSLLAINPGQLCRQRQEATILSRIQHPNVVQIYDLVEHGGILCAIIEYVDGSTLDEYTGGKPLPALKAARLVRVLAEAVHFVHEAGVLHRDIKPSNILMTLQGQPKITDFGLAKFVEGQPSLTEAGQVIGTPSFMPPEQAVGTLDDVGRPSDVYSLGAVLYAMLTGRPPFQAAATLDTLRQVLEQDPIPPRHLDSSLPQDLETIAMKCLEKSPARRYQSAQALADDLRRFELGEPVLAHPVSPRERAWRWAKRNRLTAGLSSAVLFLLITVTITAVVAAFAIDSLRQEAVFQKERAIANLQEARSERARAEQNLDYGRQAVNQLAESYALLGNQQPGLDQRLQWYEQAHSLLEDLARESPANLKFLTQLAASYGRLGLLHAQSRHSSQARDALHQAVDILEKICEEFPQVQEYQRDVAQTYNLLGKQYRMDNEYEAAQNMLARACNAQERLLSISKTPVVEWQRDLGVFYSDLGHAQCDAGNTSGGRKSYDKARVILEPLAAAHMDDAVLQETLADFYCTIGTSEASDDPQLLLSRATSILESLITAHPDRPRYRADLARVLTRSLFMQDDFEKALAMQNERRALWQQLSREQPDDAEIRYSLAWCLFDDARLLRGEGQSREALSALDRAVTIVDYSDDIELNDRDSEFVARLLADRARLQLQLGDVSAYRQTCRALVEQCRRRNCVAFGPLRVCLLMSDATDDPAELVALSKDAVTRGSTSLRKRANVGGALYRAGQYEEAIEVLRAVEQSNRIALLARLGTAEVVKADNARVELFLAMANAQLQRIDEACLWLKKALTWIDGKGTSFAPSAHHVYEERTETAGDVHSKQSGDEDNLVEITSGVLRNRPGQLELADRMFLADILCELQMLRDEAEQMIDRASH